MMNKINDLNWCDFKRLFFVFQLSNRIFTLKTYISLLLIFFSLFKREYRESKLHFGLKYVEVQDHVVIVMLQCAKYIELCWKFFYFVASAFEVIYGKKESVFLLFFLLITYKSRNNRHFRIDSHVSVCFIACLLCLPWDINLINFGIGNLEQQKQNNPVNRIKMLLN